MSCQRIRKTVVFRYYVFSCLKLLKIVFLIFWCKNSTKWKVPSSKKVPSSLKKKNTLLELRIETNKNSLNSSRANWMKQNSQKKVSYFTAVDFHSDRIVPDICFIISCQFVRYQIWRRIVFGFGVNRQSRLCDTKNNASWNREEIPQWEHVLYQYRIQD